MNQQEQKFLTPKELAERWRERVSLQTLANWRSLNYGPNFMKAGAGKNARVLYPIESVEAWEKDRLHGIR